MSSFFGWLFCRKESSMEVLRKDRQFEPVRILKTGPHYKEILCNNANGNLEFAIAKVFRGNAGMREYAEEFELLTDLKHTNIIEILAKDTLAGFRILVFRNLMNISGRIEMSIPFPAGSVQSLFKDLLTGLSFLHENKYAHRQICPENLLYTPDGVLKITGLSNIALLRDNIKQIKLKDLIGDGMYSAPECFKPAPYSGIDADIYSAGLTLYAMIVQYTPSPTDRPLHERVIEIINNAGKIDALATNLLVDILMEAPINRFSISRYLEYPFFTTPVESAMPKILQKKGK